MLTNTAEAVSEGQSAARFSSDELARFEAEGYLIARGLLSSAMRQEMRAITEDHLSRVVGPVEYEADVHYPGSPESREVEGGRTVRRLLQTHARGAVFTQFLSMPELGNRLRQLLGPDVVMPLAHHNCIMTKQPRFSSDTGWHQDIRYWSFARPDLISVWLALGCETSQNGCLKVIPGTHRMSFDRSRLDDALFLRDDLPENETLIRGCRLAELGPGDALFFHARTFHAASRNLTSEPKFSAVFTFRDGENRPRPGSRSASLPELILPGGAD